MIAILNAFEAERLKTGTWPSCVHLEQFTDRHLLDAAISLNNGLGEFEFKKSRTARTIEFIRRPAPSGSTSD